MLSTLHFKNELGVNLELHTVSQPLGDEAESQSQLLQFSVHNIEGKALTVPRSQEKLLARRGQTFSFERACGNSMWIYWDRGRQARIQAEKPV
jgi:hypothetical protein